MTTALVEVNRFKIGPAAQIEYAGPSYKNISLKYGIQVLPASLSEAILQAPITYSRKNTYLDIKYQNLEQGVPTCMLGGHVDGFNIRHDTPDLYHIWIDTFPTKFATLSGYLPKSQVKLMRRFYKGPWMSAPTKTWVSYDSYALHDGIKSPGKSKRLLVRIRESDYGHPHNQPWKPEGILYEHQEGSY